MTDIGDLIDTPQERLAYRMREFIEDLQARHKREEATLDELIETHRTRLHRLHLKVEHSYKVLMDEVLIRLNRDEDVEILEWFELVLRTKRKDLVAEIFSRATPVIRELEVRGGSLECDIRAGGHGPSGCLFRERKGGYFSFLGEFLDGFDDDVVYSVKREMKSEREQKKERDARLNAHIEEWRAKERAKRLDAEELERELGAADAALRERSLAEMESEIIGNH
jgi:hypothetical protein